MSHIWRDESATEHHTHTTTPFDAPKHFRYTRWLFWVIALGMAALVLGGAFNPVFAADRVPLDYVARQSRLIGELRHLEPACTYLGVRVSKEGHVWVDVRETIEPACEPSVNHTLIMKLKGGGWWARVKAPVPVNGWDREYDGKLGWVRVGTVEVVR